MHARLLILLALAFPGGQKPAITTLIYLVNGPDSVASFRAHAAKISIMAHKPFPWMRRDSS